MHQTLSAEYIYASKGMSIGIIQRHTDSEIDECANRIDINFSAMLKTITRLVYVFQCHSNLRQNKRKMIANTYLLYFLTPKSLLISKGHK